MISRAGWWTQTPSATLLQWKNEILIFGLCSTSDDQPGWSMDSNPICQPSPANKMKFSLCSTSDDQPGWSMDSKPICQPSPANKMKCFFLDCVHFWWSARLVDGLEPHLPPLSSQKNEMLIFGLHLLWMISQAGQWNQTPSQPPLSMILGLSMDLNPIHHLSPAKKMKCSYFDYVHFRWLAGLVNGLEPHPPPFSSQKNEIIFVLHSTSDVGYGQWTQTPSATLPNQKNEILIFGLCSMMISQACQWTWTPSATPLHPKKWNDHFWITFNFWWLAGLVDGLKPHPPQLFSQKMKSSFLDYVQLLMISQAGQWTQTPSATPLQPKKWNAHFWIMFNFRLLACRSMDSNPICQPSPTNKMKCSFLEYVQLLMISLAGLWTQTPSASPLQPKKWNATFWITFNFWWLAGLVNGLKPHPPPLSSQRNERLIFLLCSTSNDQPGLSMDLNPIHNLSPAKKWNAHFWIMFNFWWLAELLDWHLPPSLAKKWNVHFWIMFNFWWLAGLVDGLKPHPPPLSTQKHEMLIFGLHSTSDNQPGLVNGLEPHPPPLSSKKCEMLIFGLHSTSDNQPGWSMDSNPIHHPSPPKTWNACLCITFNIWCWPDWSMDSNPIHHPSPAQKMKCSFLDYVQLLIIGTAGWWTQTPSASPLQPKNEMLLFGLRSTSDDRLGWLMDSNPICQPSAAKKMKCYFLDYVQLLMIGWTSQWTQTPSSTSLQPKKWNAHFCIMFNF